MSANELDGKHEPANTVEENNLRLSMPGRFQKAMPRRIRRQATSPNEKLTSLSCKMAPSLK